MGFETPLALLALAAAGLPIVAHLLRRQDLPARRLPTIALLRRAEASSKKRVRLVDLLLLIVRVLLIGLAAMALAKPFVRVGLAYGDGSVASVAIVVDDSMSMAGRGEPSLLDRAVDRAVEVVESLPRGSEVAVVLAGKPARILVARTDERGATARALDDARGSSARGTDLAGAIELAERELAGARFSERRLLVLTDGAANAGLSDVRLPSGVDVSFERIGDDGPVPNAAVVDARALPDPTTPGRFSIAVEVRAWEMDGQARSVVLERAGEELARQPFTIVEGGARVTLHASLDPENPAATVRLGGEEDALPADDARGVAIREPAGARILVVEGDAGPTRGNDGARFLARAIDLAPPEGGALTRRQVDPETLAAMDASDADVIVLANVPAPSPRVAARLREHVERGGGLLIAPGAHFDSRAYLARLGELLPAHPRAATAAEIGGPHVARGTTLLPEGSTGLDEAHTRRRIGFDDVAPNAETQLVFDDGAPALLVASHGDGKVALLATTLDDAWTDLPYRPGYLPRSSHSSGSSRRPAARPKGPSRPARRSR